MKLTQNTIHKVKNTGDEAKTERKQSFFKEMLQRHLTETRTGVHPGPLAYSKQQSQPSTPQKAQNQGKIGPEGEEILTNIEKFAGSDPFYSKALAKKTLAEGYSHQVPAATEKRLNKFKHLIEAKAQKYGLDPNLLAGLIKQESNFNPYAVSHCGAMGLGQLMPETARYLGVKDPFNAAQNLDGAAKYLKEQLNTFGGDVKKALAAYNAGPGAVKKYGGVPPYAETQNYVKVISSNRVQITAGNYFAKKA